MGKIEEAQQILQALGLPPPQTNEISALTLLVLAQLSETTPWKETSRRSLRIHDILTEMSERYGRVYAENTRETIRRQVIHQFTQAGLVERNPDNPSLATNSPKTHYALSEFGLKALRSYGTPRWSQAVAAFTRSAGSLMDIYRQARDQYRIPVRLADGTDYSLSPGEHNELQAAVVNEFGPRFAPAAKILYLGDTEAKQMILDEAGFRNLGVEISSHGKLPDVVLYDERRNWLFLIEAVVSHGPVSPKRHLELREMLAGCTAGLVFVSAFSDFAALKRSLDDIAWNTEVWLAGMPGHLIHFNGDRFLGPSE